MCAAHTPAFALRPTPTPYFLCFFGYRFAARAAFLNVKRKSLATIRTEQKLWPAGIATWMASFVATHVTFPFVCFL